jgi:hypothetical protein
VNLTRQHDRERKLLESFGKPVHWSVGLSWTCDLLANNRQCLVCAGQKLGEEDAERRRARCRSPLDDRSAELSRRRRQRSESKAIAVDGSYYFTLEVRGEADVPELDT